MKIQYWGVFVFCNIIISIASYYGGRWEVPVMREKLIQLERRDREMKLRQDELKKQQVDFQKAYEDFRKQADRQEQLFKENRAIVMKYTKRLEQNVTSR